MKKLLALAAIVALLAPAVAVCAGADGRYAARMRDCCPQEEMTAERAAQTAPLMQESCCAMSDEANQRVPAPTSQTIASATPTTVAVPAWFRGVSVDHSAQPIHTAPQSLDHVPRHLLLSVLIV